MPLSGYTQHGGGGTQFGSVWRCEGCLPTGDFDAEARRRRGRGGGEAAGASLVGGRVQSDWVGSGLPDYTRRTVRQGKRLRGFLERPRDQDPGRGPVSPGADNRLQDARRTVG